MMEIKLLSCPVCSKPHFEGVDALRTTLVNVATNLVTCPVCCETLLGLDKLTIHLFSHISNAAASKSAIEVNVQEEIDRSIDDVSKTTTEAQEVQVEAVPEALQCDICNFSFTDRNLLEMHQKLLHQTSPDKNTGTYSYHCHLCSKKFRMRGSLMVHLRVAHYGFWRTDNATTDSGQNNDETVAQDRVVGEKKVVVEVKSIQKSVSVRGSDNKQWECDVCSKMFTTKYFLKKHKRLHTGEMPYCCSLCNKLFTFQQSYHKHMLYHSSEKPHVCNECGRAFKELSTLQNHARIHSGERPFVCETCGKSFRQRVSYLVHRRIHTGVMPYKCTACDKSFRYKVSQKSHKCSANPPGSVIRVAEQKSNSPIATSPTYPMIVEATSGVVDVSPKFHASETNQAQVQKKSILLNNNEMIEISYNKADLQLAIENGGKNLKRAISEISTQEKKSHEKLDDFQKLIYADPDRDLFSVTLSPLLPDVESLYLNNSPTSNVLHQEHDQTGENVGGSGEKYLEEFLYDI